MKRNVGKSKSFQMRRSTNNTSSVPTNKRRDRSMDRRIIRSYDDIHSEDNNFPDLHLSDDSDNEDERVLIESMAQETDEVETSRYEDWSQWIRLPNLMFNKSSSSGSPSKNTFKAPPRTRSKFKPAYLLQRRKEGLAQHPAPPSYFPEVSLPSSRNHSFLSLLFVATGFYLLISLMNGTSVPTILQPSQSTQTLYYLNLKEEEPIRIVSKMLTLHAYAFQQPAPSRFAGVCGYPTYQQESQRKATTLLVEMGLQEMLHFDTCPPIEAVLNKDPQYVLMEEADLPPSKYLTNPGWQATLAAESKPTARDPTELWRQVMDPASTTTSTTDARRRLRGLN